MTLITCEEFLVELKGNRHAINILKWQTLACPSSCSNKNDAPNMMFFSINGLTRIHINDDDTSGNTDCIDQTIAINIELVKYALLTFCSSVFCFVAAALLQRLSRYWGQCVTRDAFFYLHRTFFGWSKEL